MLNKEKTGRMIRIVALLVAVTFVLSFVPMLSSSFFGTSRPRSSLTPPPKNSSAAPVDKIRNLLDQADTNFKSQNYTQAIIFYQQALAVDANNAAARTGLGASQLLSGQAEAAYSELKQAVNIDPNYADGQFYLGKAAAKLGEAEEAKAAYNAYLKLNPNGDRAAEARTALEELS